jgi:hypothetical protein
VCRGGGVRHGLVSGRACVMDDGDLRGSRSSVAAVLHAARASLKEPTRPMTPVDRRLFTYAPPPPRAQPSHSLVRARFCDACRQGLCNAELRRSGRFPTCSIAPAPPHRPITHLSSKILQRLTCRDAGCSGNDYGAKRPESSYGLPGSRAFMESGGMSTRPSGSLPPLDPIADVPASARPASASRVRAGRDSGRVLMRNSHSHQHSSCCSNPQPQPTPQLRVTGAAIYSASAAASLATAPPPQRSANPRPQVGSQVLLVEHPLDDTEVASSLLLEDAAAPADAPSPPKPSTTASPEHPSFTGRRTYTRPSEQQPPVESPSPLPSPSPPSPPPPPSLGDEHAAWCGRMDQALDTMTTALSHSHTEPTALLAAVDAVDELVVHALAQPQVG